MGAHETFQHGDRTFLVFDSRYWGTKLGVPVRTRVQSKCYVVCVLDLRYVRIGNLAVSLWALAEIARESIVRLQGSHRVLYAAR